MGQDNRKQAGLYKLKPQDSFSIRGASPGVVMAEVAMVAFLLVVSLLGFFVFLTNEVTTVDERANAADAITLSLNHNPTLLVVEKGVTKPAPDLARELAQLAGFVSLNAGVESCAALYEFDRGDCDGTIQVISHSTPGEELCSQLPNQAQCPGLFQALQSQCDPQAPHHFYAGVCFVGQEHLSNIYLASVPNTRRYLNGEGSVAVAMVQCAEQAGQPGNIAWCCESSGDGCSGPDCSGCNVGQCDCDHAGNAPCCPEGSVCAGLVPCSETGSNPPCAWTLPVLCNDSIGYADNTAQCCPAVPPARCESHAGPSCERCLQNEDDFFDCNNQLCCPNGSACHIPSCDSMGCHGPEYEL